MSTNRQPAGTSIGGQWAPGAAAEVEDGLDDIDRVEEEQARAWSQKYPDHTVGVGRLVGDNEACAVAEDAIARKEASDAFNADFSRAIRGIGHRHPDAQSVSVKTDYSRAVVTGDYTDAGGKTRRLSDDHVGELQQVYDSDPISGYKIVAEDGVYSKDDRDSYEVDVGGVVGGSRDTSTRLFNAHDEKRIAGGQRAASSFMVTSRSGEDTFHYVSGGKVWWDRLPPGGEGE